GIRNLSFSDCFDLNPMTIKQSPNNHSDLDRALIEVSASSAGGAPFLIALGATFLACAALWFFFPTRTAALMVMFQGSVALPLAFGLERRLGSKRMAPDNPLRPLSVQM